MPFLLYRIVESYDFKSKASLLIEFKHPDDGDSTIKGTRDYRYVLNSTLVKKPEEEQQVDEDQSTAQ